jgi:hypothetical protein
VGVRDRQELLPAPIAGDTALHADETVREIRFDRRGNTWFATEQGVIRRAVNGETRTFQLSEVSLRNLAYGLHEDDEGRIWVAYVGGIARIVGDSVEHLPYPDQRFTYPAPVLAGAADGTIVISTSARGGAFFRWDGHRFVPMLQQFLDRSDRIRAVRALPDSSWAIGTEAGRLLIWRPGSLTQVVAEHLGGSAIVYILPRPTGGFWLGTETDGVVELTRQPARSLAGGGERLPSAVSVTTDSQGARWAALACNGIVRQDRSGKLARYRVRPCVSAILEAAAGRFWLGTDNGLYRWAPGEEVADAPLVSGRINALYQDRTGRLWVGGQQVLMVQKAPGATEFRPLRLALPADVQVIEKDQGGTIWVGTAAGLFRVREDVLVPVRPRGLPTTSVRALHADRAGRLWAGTYGSGLWLIADSTATGLTTSDGLPESVVSWIGEDDEGNFFLAGNRGVHRVARHSLLERLSGRGPSIAFLTIGVTERREPLEVNGGSQPAGAWHPDGSLLVPTIHGPISIDVSRIADWSLAPAVQIHAVMIDQQVQVADTAVVLAPSARRVDIEFSAVDFDRAAGLVYQYRLVPYDTTWVTGGIGRAVFTRLPPGEYTFEAQAINDRGVVSGNPAALLITVEPRFTQTAGFRVLVVVFILVTAFGGAWFWSAAARRRERELKREVEAAVAKVRVITGMLPICAWCKKIRNDAGAWRQFEQYVLEHTDATLTHGMCEDCSVTMLAGRSSSPL